LITININMANPNTLKIKLNRGIVVAGATEPRGEPTYGKPGEVVELDTWTARYLCSGEYPAAELVTKK
jgi:hypothetical protein